MITRTPRRITKKPKRITVTDEEFIASQPRYVCPSCGAQYLNGDPSKYTTRFFCPCGQELIVEKRIRRPVVKEET